MIFVVNNDRKKRQKKQYIYEISFPFKIFPFIFIKRNSRTSNIQVSQGTFQIYMIFDHVG